MVPLTMLWLPILVSAVLVFIASNILWMMLPFWHSSDYKRLADEQPMMNALTPLSPGQYIFPWLDWKNATPERKAELAKLPSGYMIVRGPGTFGFGKAIFLWFVYIVIVSVFVAYLTGRTVAAGTEYLLVFRVAGTAGTMAWALGSDIANSIWYGRPW
ncbi:MAG: hypothetical protein ACLGH0_08795, partial [Thermoanaerobaculia bacterium]